MKKFFKILGVTGIALVFYVVYIFSSTGYFRSIVNKGQGKIVQKIPIAGVEDITVDEDDGFAIFISYDRAAERDGSPKQGGIFSLDLTKNDFQVRSLSSGMDLKLSPHGISLLQLSDIHHKLFVANHADGESIEVFNLYHKDSLVHDKTIRDKSIYAINDIVAISETEFYFTNDHYYQNTVGRLAENYLGLAKCETVYYDGADFRVVDNSLAYANGINYDQKRNLMFIASPRGFKIKVFHRLQNGDLEYYDTIKTGTGIDNLEFDDEGNIWSGCHPNLLAFTAYAKGKKSVAPSEVVKINYRGKGDYSVASIFVDDGSSISATSVAAVYKNIVLMGNVMDDHFLILKN